MRPLFFSCPSSYFVLFFSSLRAWFRLFLLFSSACVVFFLFSFFFGFFFVRPELIGGRTRMAGF